MTDGIDFRGTYRALSNFSEHYSVTVYGWTFPTGEHAFAAMKNPDPEHWKRVSEAKTPGGAKRLGRNTELRPDWDTFRITAMLTIIAAKTVQNPDVLSTLLGTGHTRLVERNAWHDNFWGDCECQDRRECASPGENMLGRIWMAQRHYWRYPPG